MMADLLNDSKEKTEVSKKSMNQLGKELAEEHAAPTVLSHDETLRATALSLACRYYVETIVKDGDLYREMVRDNRVLKPATYVGVIEVAASFEMFINGELKQTANGPTTDVDDLTKTDRATPES